MEFHSKQNPKCDFEFFITPYSTNMSKKVLNQTFSGAKKCIIKRMSINCVVLREMNLIEVYSTHFFCVAAFCRTINDNFRREPQKKSQIRK